MELKIPGKSIFEIRNQKFCYIQVIDFDLSYLSSGFGFQKCFSRNFQFHRRDPIVYISTQDLSLTQATSDGVAIKISKVTLTIAAVLLIPHYQFSYRLVHV